MSFDRFMAELRDASDAQQTAAEWTSRVARIFSRLAVCASDARRALGAGGDAEELREALGVLRGQLEECLRVEGASLYGTEGDLVDPARHAIVEVRPPAGDESRVLEVLREGLIWGSQIVHKALVVASRLRAPPET